jgi:hypothetical protein
MFVYLYLNIVQEIIYNNNIKKDSFIYLRKNLKDSFTYSFIFFLLLI